MDSDTPIVPDLEILPRKTPITSINLVGLTRDALQKALLEMGTPERQIKMRVGQIWQWIYEKGVREFV